MVAPYRHVPSPEMLSQEESADLWNSLMISIDVIRRAMNPDGFNIGMNLGRVAGAGFEGHIHIHVVPRWNGDTNFMPVISDTKVLGEALESTYRRLKEVMEK
jgi:Diadenosine tetraphosphate (Ap4A) hydrolase and other HIT family hydrolases